MPVVAMLPPITDDFIHLSRVLLSVEPKAIRIPQINDAAAARC
jgi:hypothetical protein